MRAFWSGAISFGLVNIPIKLYSASQESALDFDFLHKKDLSPIRFARVCCQDEQEIPYEEIVRGFEYRKGDYIVLNEEDFKKADIRKTKTIDILNFSNEKEIDPIYYEKPYFLEPDKGAEKPYALLREALSRSKKVGIAKFVLRNKEHLGIIKPDKDVIVLNQLRFKEEIRNPEELKLPQKEVIKENEVDLALALVDQLTKSFQPNEFKDTYTEALKEIIEKKAQGMEIKPRGEEPVSTEVKDLMSVLKASLKQEREKVGSRK